MNTLIIYFSRFGNTRTAAETVSDILTAAGPVRTLSAERLTPADLQQAPLIILLFLTHIGVIFFCGFIEWRGVLAGRDPGWTFEPKPWTRDAQENIHG